MNEITAGDMRRLNNFKVVVLIERRPLSDRFEQIMLTDAQYRQVNDLIWSMMPAGAANAVLVTTQNKRPIMLENIKETYTQADIDASPDEVQ